MAIVAKVFLAFLVVYVSGARSMPQIDLYDAVEVGLQDDFDKNEEVDPREICNMPMVKGHCRGLFLRYGYDPSARTCRAFNYGGCSGNSNNFHTKKQCFRMCQGV